MLGAYILGGGGGDWGGLMAYRGCGERELR